MKRVPDKQCSNLSKHCVLTLLITLLLAFAVQATEQQDESAELEALFEFLGSLNEEPDEWNEFFDLAVDGLPPEFGEEADE
ncbi:MAG: hypothetical protein ACR2QG_07200 [Gammaproteobacteria bacterium]